MPDRKMERVRNFRSRFVYLFVWVGGGRFVSLKKSQETMSLCLLICFEEEREGSGIFAIVIMCFTLFIA